MRMFTGAMEPYNRTDLKHKGIGSKEVVDDDGEVLLSPKDALQACEKMQRFLEEAFSSLIRTLICPPKVVRPKLLDSRDVLAQKL